MDKTLETKPNQINLGDHMITDPAKVIAILPLHKETNFEEVFNVGQFGKFKKFEGETKLVVSNLEKMESEKFCVGDSIYSIEYLELARKTAKAFNGETIPEFYKRFEDNKFLEDEPLLIRFNNLLFILAPRVETGE